MHKFVILLEPHEGAIRIIFLSATHKQFHVDNIILVRPNLPNAPRLPAEILILSFFRQNYALIHYYFLRLDY